jgi:hypothetical protein
VEISLEVRAYAFWSLEEYWLFEILLQGRHPSELTFTLLDESGDTIFKKLQ